MRPQLALLSLFLVLMGVAVLAEPAPAPLARLPTLRPEAGLSYEVRDAKSGELIPAKLTLLGVGETPTPELTHNDIGRHEGNAIAAYNRIMSLSGLGVAPVPLGVYDVYVSRGPEWDLFVARKVHVSAKGAEVRARLDHVVDSAQWLSADFHVHAASSPDSRVPMIDRVFEFASDGVEMIVSTDHNVVSDYAPLIAELSAGRVLASATGDELTTASWGHFGAFPLPQSLARSGHGAIFVHERTAKDMFGDVRKEAPGAVIDIHHPRLDNEIGYFNLGQLDSASDRAARHGFSFDFDAIEVLNGYQDAERKSVDRVINDWFQLLGHNHLVTATGNSDTHHLTYNLGGYPRNYVRVQEDRPAVIKPEEVARAVKAHRLFFTTGPFVKVTVGKSELGETARAEGGKVYGRIEVQAAPWVSVSRAILYVDGKEHTRWHVPPSEARVRFSHEFELSLARDAYVVVRIDGDHALSPVVGDLKRFEVFPFALTNPIFVDVDGNGVYDSPWKHGPH